MHGTAQRIASYVSMALGGLFREYPVQVPLRLREPTVFRSPRERWPVFYGCFDWHSSVHSHWALCRALRCFPEADFAGEVEAALRKSLRPDALATEAAYLQQWPSFERPYGLAWAMLLWAEASAGEQPWAASLAPLGEAAEANLRSWLPKLTHPLRSGTHSNSAFALGLVWDAAKMLGRVSLMDFVQEQGERLYGADRDYPLHLEPSGHDFLSPSLAPVDLLRRWRSPADLEAFAQRTLGMPFYAPVQVSDIADGHLAHLDGLNASRAWMAEGIAGGLGSGALRDGFDAVSSAHLRAAEASIDGAHYAGSHWLGSFMIYLLTCAGRPADF